ncbi:hypothetical protein PPERSA_01187 [Pseudocohnilembus persalinus]|uniref:Uncharacterized protein n=1 Tax=Pseudocohnilembus persalinus TaxID=266149 RepID=A0A0V0R196_PSEPJ|nr:hypothetical protein PPERSA_01187 [Pseudocohnilembus persalinus]|eukprot:KRX08257.1 hypothetical protein PPERSA_01187 [Pseudocohnilembus persalinus]
MSKTDQQFYNHKSGNDFDNDNNIKKNNYFQQTQPNFNKMNKILSQKNAQFSEKYTSDQQLQSLLKEKKNQQKDFQSKKIEQLLSQPQDLNYNLNIDQEYNWVPEYVSVDKQIKQQKGKSLSPQKPQTEESPLKSTGFKFEQPWIKIETELFKEIYKKQQLEKQEQLKYGKLLQIEQKTIYESIRIELTKEILKIKENALAKANARGHHQGKFQYWHDWNKFIDPKEYVVDGD